jgi:hypothetical protein
MKNMFIKLFAILSCILMPVVIGQARSTKNTDFEVPFEFIVKDQVFPAGKYSIARLSEGNPNLLIIKRVDGKERTVFLTHNSIDKEPHQPLLTFKRYEDKYYLESIWIKGNPIGQKVLVGAYPPQSPKDEKVQMGENQKCRTLLETEIMRPI